MIEIIRTDESAEPPRRHLGSAYVAIVPDTAKFTAMLRTLLKDARIE